MSQVRTMLGLNLRALQNFFGGKKISNLKSQTDQHDFSSQKTNSKQKFIFKHGESIESQINAFKELQNNEKWDGRIAFLGFKGLFKFEYWAQIENAMRSISGSELKKLTFIDTKIENEHLDLLLSIIQWIQPQDLQLKFKQNELDDSEMEKFVREGILKNFSNIIQSLEVISNPGVYKGHMLKRFKEMIKEINSRNKQFQLHFLQNKDSKSFAYIKIPLNESQEDIKIKKEKLQEKLKETFYYKLNLKNCFTEDNNEGLFHLINESYNNKKMEQIEVLDISGSQVNQIAKFQKFCQKISSSKGLLDLGIGKVSILENNQLMQSLMGDRYDQLRLNHLDFSDNENYPEITILTLARNLFTDSLKTVEFNNSFGEHVPVLLKMQYISNIMKAQNEKLYIQSIKVGYIKKQKFRHLDLSSFENYNRHDLIQVFLLQYVFNEHSSIKKLVCQNFDVGRIQSWTESIQIFETHIAKMKKEFPLIYNNFKPELFSIEIPKQRYSMEMKPMHDFFKFCFTNDGSLFNISDIILKECFGLAGRQEGLQEFCLSLKKIYESNPKIKFTLKKIIFQSSNFDSNIGWDSIFEDIVFNSHFQIESLSIISEEPTTSNQFLFSTIKNFFQTIQPDQICNLKHLIFMEIYSFNIDIFEFIDLMIFNKKIKLETLVMKKISVKDNEEYRKSLINQYQENQFNISLQKLILGPFYQTTNEIDSALAEILILNYQSELVDIEINSLQLKQSINILKDKMLDKIKNGLKPLNSLNILKIQMNDELTQGEWECFSDVFIFSKYVNLKTLEINQTTVSDQFVQGLSASKAKRIQQLEKEEQSQSSFHINSLIINQCSLEVEFLSIFFTSILCKLERLHIIECYAFDIVLQKLKNIYSEESNFFEYQTVSLTELVMDGTEVQDTSLFEWFLKEIVFNKERQRVTKISFQNCGIKSEQMSIISKTILGIKNFQSEHKIKKYYQLRQINLSQNNMISSKDWKDFFNILFTAYDTSINDDIFNSVQVLVEEQKNIDQVEQQTLQKIVMKENLIEQTKKIIFEKKLNLDYKILDVRNQIKIQVPSQLKEIDVNLKFELEQSDVKGELYQRIMKGLVFFPQSNVEKVTFSNLDLELFMIASEKAIEFTRKYQKILKNLRSNENILLNLKFLVLKDISNASEQNVSKFTDLYLDDQIFNLVGLNIQSLDTGNIYKDILRNFQKQLHKGQVLTLKQLELNNVQSILNIEETLSFFQTIILNKSVPLEILHLGLSLEINSEENFQEQIYNHLNVQNQQISLKDLQININDQQTFKTIQAFIPFIFTSKYIQLEKLNFYHDQNEDLQTFIRIGNEILVQNFCILSDITFSQKMHLTLNEFQIFLKIRPQLKQLKLCDINTKFWVQKDVENFMNTQQSQILQIQQPCKLIITVGMSDHNETDILNQFVFSKLFSWTNVQLNSFTSFENIQNANFQDCVSLEKPFLKILSINLDLIYSSQLQLSEQGLKLIGDSFIYNENSILEELILKQCHLKPAGIKSLTSSAQNFRESILKNNQIKTMKLKLKRFSIYYSLYLLEAQDIISYDIVFFEYINIERYENEVTNFNDSDAINLCKAANKWLQFQLDNKRQIQQQFFIRYLDIGRNEFVQSKEAWDLLCDTFIFTDKTPSLQELNIHFMSLQDFHVDWICEKACDFFMWKPYNYVHPIKFLNFELNTALSSKGWQKICENFFFNKHFRLEQLNLIGTMLDTEEKVNAIKEAIIRRAISEKNKKIPMHTFLSWNCQIKLPVMQYMSPKPLNYIPNQDVMVEIDDCSSFGLIEGLPSSFGDIIALSTKAIYQCQNYANSDYLQDENDLRFSQYHLEIVEGFLKPLSQLFSSQKNLDSSLPISYQSVDQLCTFFKYRLNDGDPYPISIFFNHLAIQYYYSIDCKIRSINFIGSTLKKQELVQQTHVFKLWEELKSQKSCFDTIFMEYTIDDDLVDMMFDKGYNEIDLINLVRLIPPSQMRFQNSLSLQAIKGIYSIMWDNYQFSYSNISIDKHIFLNVGIGYSLREYVYNSNPQNLISKGMKRFFYYFFSFFVTSVPEYNFSQQIIDLNRYLSNQGQIFWMLIFITLIYYAVCVYASFYFTMNYGQKLEDSSELDKDYICLHGPHIYGLYTYAVIAFISFLFEGFLYKNIAQIIPKHIKGIFEVNDKNQIQLNQIQTNKNSEELSISKKNSVNDAPNIENQNLVFKKSITIKEQFKTLSQSKTVQDIGYLKEIILGQLAKFDLFNDISFILSCYFCQFQNLFIIALAVTSFNIVVHAMNFFRFIFQRIMEDKSNKKKLSTKYINDFYSISIIGRNQALSTVLDTVAPFNVSAIHNNFLTKFFIPQLAGKSISNSVKVKKIKIIKQKIYLMKFSFEDLPQILLQIIFLLYVSLKLNQPINVITWITIANSSFSLFLSFVKFMSIRPSSLSQYDFDLLSDKKSREFMDFQIEELRKEQQIIKALTGQETNINNNEYNDDVEIIVEHK